MMLVEIFPQQSQQSSPKGQLRSLFEMLQKKRPRLFALARSTIEAIERSDNLDFLTDTGKMVKLPGCKEPIYVLKLPPKGLKEGVIRIYFAFDQYRVNCIWLLSGELKHGTNKDDPEMIKRAILVYRDVCKLKPEGKK